jgi:replication-associated recombination protein RarA
VTELLTLYQNNIKERILELCSAVQKCIRRGLEEDALRFALELETLNKTALWNRLKIIASEDIGPANPFMPLLVDVLEKQYLHEGLDNARLIFLSNAVVCLCRSSHSRVTDDLLNVVLLEKKQIPIPDFALDMHTARGRAMGRGWKEFFEEGSQLVNESGTNPYRERHKKLQNL